MFVPGRRLTARRERKGGDANGRGSCARDWIWTRITPRGPGNYDDFPKKGGRRIGTGDGSVSVVVRHEPAQRGLEIAWRGVVWVG